MIITVASPELASHLHDHGRGWRARDREGNAFWVNADLIKADREANYQARKLARNRRPGRFVPQVIDELNVSATSASAAGSPTRSPTVHVNRVPVLNRENERVRSVSPAGSVASRRSRNQSPVIANPILD